MYLVPTISHTLTKEFIERVNNSEYHCMQNIRNRQNQIALDPRDVTGEFLKRQLLTTPLLPQAVKRL